MHKKIEYLKKLTSQLKFKSIKLSTELEGSTPPSVFVGKAGYPKVFVGPMMSLKEESSLLDLPEEWLAKTKNNEEIVALRMQLIRGKKLARLKEQSSFIEKMQAIALAKSSFSVEAEFQKKPKGMFFHEDVQPFGPSGELKNLQIGNRKFNPAMEKAYYDTDLKSKDAILEIYRSGVHISKIQRAFSVGAFGIKKYRRFVPTRWSITAVDSTIGEALVKEVKSYPLLDSWLVYYTKSLDNLWVVIMYPSSWEYELIEAWYPNTTWNPLGKKIIMFGDHEFYKGRKTYASIGGCYYAARMAAAEHLRRMRRQAGVVVLREIHPGYIMPVGVWNVRENVRRALKGEARKFDSLKEAMLFVSSILFIPVERWIETSALLQNRIKQARIDDFYEVQKRIE